VLADKGYDSDEIVQYAEKQEIIPVIPPRCNRKNQIEYNKKLYKIENETMARRHNKIREKSLFF
jgi:IS5 family transposase